MVSIKPPVIDGHIDTALQILKENRKFSECSKTGHCYLPRMKEANFQAALFAIESGYTMESNAILFKVFNLTFVVI